MAASRDILSKKGWDEGEQRGCTTNNPRPALLPNILQRTGQPPQQRIVWPKMPTVPRLRNFALQLHFTSVCVFICWDWRRYRIRTNNTVFNHQTLESVLAARLTVLHPSLPPSWEAKHNGTPSLFSRVLAVMLNGLVTSVF